MAKTQKKNSKGRLDRYYHLAKDRGYRARSAFKLIQVNEKFGHFLERSKVVIDLCAAPGSWCQVASHFCPINSLVIGVDVVPIRPLPNCITFQSDITTEDCNSKLRGYMKTWKADTVLHDGAPNVGMGWIHDAFTQSQLTLLALKLAVEHLANGGNFITKIFRSRDYNNLMWAFQQLFDKVEATKPPASRDVSAEIFVVCKGFKAPRKLDPRLLDPKEIFEELSSGNINNEAKIFNPEKAKRQREGYEEGDYTLYHEKPLLDFIKDEQPIKDLGYFNRLIEPEESNVEWRILKKLRSFTPELLACIQDLRVLGKKEFKYILKFRKQAREILGYDSQEEKPEIETAPLTEDQQIDKNLEDLSTKQRLKERRAKKLKNELKNKEIQRMQMSMLSDMRIGIDAVEAESKNLFNIQSANKTRQLDSLIRGKKAIVLDNGNDDGIEVDVDKNEMDTDDENDELEKLLDHMYRQYQERKSEKISNYEAKKKRGDADDEGWDGFDSNANEKSDDDSDHPVEDDSPSDDDEEIEGMVEKRDKELSSNARAFFSSENIFNGFKEEDLLREMSRTTDPRNEPQRISNDNNLEIVPNKMDMDDVSDTNPKNDSNHQYRKDVDIATVEAMTLAHQVGLGQKTKNDLIEEGINKYSFRDQENLPEWFIDDEKQHSKIVKPITKEAAAALKEKEKQLNARPIKKVLEARGRKKTRALKRLEKLKKKSEVINDDSTKSERDKSEEIQRLMKRMNTNQDHRPKPTLVVAKGSNRGIKGRPRGVKGKYKMVDGPMKKEKRALRSIAKRHRK